MTLSAAALADCALALIQSNQRNAWAGADPYDALWEKRLPRVLSGGRRRRQAIIQLHARAPLNIRRLHRAGNPVIAKALATFGLASTRLHRLQATEETRALALDALTRLCADESAGPDAWGYPFPVQTRWSYYGAGTPNVVVTSFAVAALTEAADVLGVDQFRTRAHRAASWVLSTLFDRRLGAFVYHPSSDALIHNANLLGARAVAQACSMADGARAAIRQAVAQTSRGQRPDGSWPYGSGTGLEFVDSFHTGFVLDCLVSLADVAGVDEATLRKGSDFYLSHFFGPRGEAQLWPDRHFPQDAHAAGTGLTTIAALARSGIIDGVAGRGLAGWTVSDLVRDGHCVCRRYRWGPTRVTYPRWCDAHAALGLASYASIASG